MGENLFTLEIDIRAIEGIANAFEKFPAIARQEFGRAIKKLVLRIERKAKRHCPVATGKLRASITATVESWAYAFVATNTEYAPWVEFGTDPHDITPSTASALTIPTDDGTILRKKVRHPGTDPQPFMEPAYEYGKKIAPEIFGDALKRIQARLLAEARS